MTSPLQTFPSFELTDKFMAKLAKTDILAQAARLKEFQEQKACAKTDGKKKRTITGILKLEDANEAGGKHSKKCTLIICEGDSAKTFAIAGLGVVGRDFYGVYPLKGKPLNVREASLKSVTENQELIDLKKILGLNKEVKSIDDLRYGQLMIMADEDDDGQHIKGLVMNMFDVFWKPLLSSGFIVSMYTPLVKVLSGKKTIGVFYSENEFHMWKQTHSITPSMRVRFYKGLGTHTADEARECFKSLKLITYVDDEKTSDMMDIVFADSSKKRKEWIANHAHQPIDRLAKQIKISEFIDRGLIAFADVSNMRSIPSIMDGLKPAHRKVLCGMMMRKCVDEIKVCQVSQQVSADMKYHHGEKSLNDTVVKMAQNFVGSNNINFLHPQGQFGTRLKGGADAASPRYTFTFLEPITRKIFRPEDDPILVYRIEDDCKVEPCFFVPVIPMVLVNGASGIGTGFSTDVPCFNPHELIARIKVFLTSSAQHFQPHPPSTIGPNVFELDALVPWYRKFTGTIKADPTRSGKFICTGKWSYDGHNKRVRITELPIGTWTDNYRKFLTKKLESGALSKIAMAPHQDEAHIDFLVDVGKVGDIGKPNDEGRPDDVDAKSVEKLLDLTTTLHTTNMHVFDPFDHLALMSSPMDILEAFCKYRIGFYVRRKDYMMQQLRKKLVVLSEKVRFVRMVVTKQFRLMDTPKAEVLSQLGCHNFKQNPHLIPIVMDNLKFEDWVSASDPHVVKSNIYSRIYVIGSTPSTLSTLSTDLLTLSTDPSTDVNGTHPSSESNDSLQSYRYLTSIPLFNFTTEEIRKLETEHDEQKKELDLLSVTTPQQLWLRDLEELEQELKRHNKDN